MRELTNQHSETRNYELRTKNQVGYVSGIAVRNPLLTRVLNSLVRTDLNCGLNAALRPELARRLSAVLKPALRSEFGPELRSRLEPGFMAEFCPVLNAVLRSRLTSVLNAVLSSEVTPGVTPLLTTQIPTQVPPIAHPHSPKSCQNRSLMLFSTPTTNLLRQVFALCGRRIEAGGWGLEIRGWGYGRTKAEVRNQARPKAASDQLAGGNLQSSTNNQAPVTIRTRSPQVHPASLSIRVHPWSVVFNLGELGVLAVARLRAGGLAGGYNFAGTDLLLSA